jgi:DNA-binding transcriptional ArsR family regulator
VVWQIIRGWTDVLAETGERSAVLFGAMASPSRLRIVVELIGGEVTTAELARRLDQPSTGQMFHHLKELLAAGVIYQPVRGTYAIRREHAVPVLTMLCAALDIRESIPTEAHDDHEHG